MLSKDNDLKVPLGAFVAFVWAVVPCKRWLSPHVTGQGQSKAWLKHLWHYERRAAHPPKTELVCLRYRAGHRLSERTYPIRVNTSHKPQPGQSAVVQTQTYTHRNYPTNYCCDISRLNVFKSALYVSHRECEDSVCEDGVFPHCLAPAKRVTVYGLWLSETWQSFKPLTYAQSYMDVIKGLKTLLWRRVGPDDLQKSLPTYIIQRF